MRLYWVALVLSIIGCINWGLVGLFDYDLVRNLFGDTGLTRTIYAIVGASGVYLIFHSLGNQIRKSSTAW
jgi:uncharacterized membrane protein YuzA (DUF378 family)